TSLLIFDPRSSLRRVADRFDVVAVEIEHEGTVVAGMVVRPQAWCTVVATARSESGLEEVTHRGPALGRERAVRRGRCLAVAADPELGLAALAEAAGPDLALGLLRPDLHHQGDPERCQRRNVEGLGAPVVGNSEADMIDDHA